MYSHVFVSVSDFERALRFYGAVMDSLGVELRFCERERPWPCAPPWPACWPCTAASTRW